MLNRTDILDENFVSLLSPTDALTLVLELVALMLELAV